MQLHNLKPNSGANQKKRRVGRGNGSGKGTYSGRGCKGQNARSGGNRRPGFEGGQTPLLRKLPKLRGFTAWNPTVYQAVNLGDLDKKFAEGEEVTRHSLSEKNMIRTVKKPVKLLSKGELTKKLVIKLDAASKSALDGVKKSGSTVEVLTAKKVEEKEKSPKKEVSDEKKTDDVTPEEK